MPLFSQDVWHVDRRVSILAIVKSEDMLMHFDRILAIALSRLRMTVGETIIAFESVLHAMYAVPRNKVPLATRYSHSNLELALASMARKYCKQHERGLCMQNHRFSWSSTDYEDLGDGGDSEESENKDSFDTWRNRSSLDSKLRASKRRTLEDQLCQT